jgi:hypothetical protein
MSARYIYDTAPLGSLIRFSDGTPKPPVEQKWTSDGNGLWEAENWAIELIEDYARQLNIALLKWEDIDPPSPPNATLSASPDA